MIPFLAAQFLVYAAVASTAILSNRPWLESEPWEYGAKPAMLLAALPLLGAWTACELLRLVRPVRLLDRRVRGVLVRAVAGLCAGLLALIATMLAVEFVTGVWVEFALTFSAAFLATATIALCSSRQRPGACTQCRYDLSTITTAARGRCPECGSALHAA